MKDLHTVLVILQLIICLAMIVVVLSQSGKRSGLSGAISGAAETFLAKNKAKSVDAILAKSTKWFAIAFVVITLALYLVQPR